MCFFGTMGTIPCFASPSLCLEMCEESILLKDTMDTTLERVTETTSSSTKRHCCVVVVVFFATTILQMCLLPHLFGEVLGKLELFWFSMGKDKSAQSIWEYLT